MTQQDPTTTPFRFDLLVWEFIMAMAQNMGEGAARYGDEGWKTNGRDPFDHAKKHLEEYQKDPSTEHLVHAACNLMMCYWHVTHGASPEPPWMRNFVGDRNDE